MEKIYCDDAIPQYEINERTLGILLELKCKNEERESEAQILIKDYQEKTEEYHAEGETNVNTVAIKNISIVYRFFIICTI